MREESQSDRETRYLRRMQQTRVLSFTSGKGGVGKSHTVANIGIALAAAGRSVLLLDADLGLANLDVLLNLKPKYTLHDLLKGTASLSDIILEGPGGISVLPASSGVEELANLTQSEQMKLMYAVEQAAAGFDYLLLDTPAGIGSDVMFFNSAAENVVVVVTPEPTSLTDAYALMKVMHRSKGEKRFWVVVNRVASMDEAAATFRKLARVVDRHLKVSVRLMGAIPEDPLVRECVMEQRSVVLEWPSRPAARALVALAGKIDLSAEVVPLKGGVQFFFESLLGVAPGGKAAII